MSNLIDRQAAIDAVNAYLGLSAVSRTVQNMTSIQEILEKLPSAQPDQRAEELLPDGTLHLFTDTDLSKVNRVWVSQNNTHYGDLYYADYTEDEIQKMQDLKQAEVEKVFELGREDANAEIIYCKDCKHGAPNGKYGCKLYHYRLYETHEMKPDDFCSQAERRTDEGD